jgi:hypothetical protein
MMTVSCLGKFGEGGDMTGKSPTGEGFMIFRGRKHFGRGTGFLLLYFSGVGSLILGVFVNLCRGHGVVGGSWHGGQDSLRYPGAREPDRLLLVGWVVIQNGQSSRETQQGGHSEVGNLASPRSIFRYAFS